MSAKLNPDGFMVSQTRVWRCTLTDPPEIGATVRVLNQDGCDAGKCTWTANSHKVFYGWQECDSIPDIIKQRILSRYPLAPEATMNSYEWMQQAEFRGLVILDPDGWDRSSIEAFNRSMHQMITREEFLERVGRSTVGGLRRKLPIHAEIEPPRDMWDRRQDIANEGQRAS